MEFAKKMVLVDPKSIGVSTQSVINPPAVDVPKVVQPELGAIEVTLHGLQHGLQQLLQNHDLPPDDKMKLYSNFLQQYLTMRRKQRGVYMHPSGVSLKVPVVEEKKEESIQRIEAQVVDAVPKPLQKYARLLLDRVKEEPELGWNERGELVVEQQVVPQSNIIDLIGDLLRKRKNFNPPGWRELSRKLYESNVPQNLIRNPDRLAYMVGTSSQEHLSSPSAIQSAIEELDPTRTEPSVKAKRKRRKPHLPVYASRLSPRGRRHKLSSIFTDENWETY